MNQDHTQLVDIPIVELENEDDNQLPPYIQETVEDILTQQPIFFETEIQKGNFEILLLCSPDFSKLDSSGYNILHHAITYSRADVVEYALQRGADHNIASKYGQTCLMIASSFGQVKLAKIFINLGEDVNGVDEFGYTPLFYAVKSRQHKMALLLIHEGAVIERADHQGCSVMHWAAYNNDTFLLQYFDGLEYKLLDNAGNTPAMRAISNQSADALRYLLDRYPEMMPGKMIEISSPGLNQLVKRAQFKWNCKTHRYLKWLCQFYNDNFKLIQIILIVFLFTLLFIHLDDEVFKKLVQTSNGQNLMIAFLVVSIYCFIYTLWFILATTNRQDEGTKIYNRLGHPKIHFECNQQDHNNHNHNHNNNTNDIDINIEIEQVQQEQQEEQQQLNIEYQHPHGFIDKIIEKEEDGSLDLSRTCLKCQVFQSKQQWHCEYCGICVNGFQFHSLLLNKCINNTNHLFYLFVLLSYIILSIFYYYLMRFVEAEINYQSSSLSQIVARLVALSMILCLPQYIFNIYLICRNLTYHELINPQFYTYLYETVQINGILYRKLRFSCDIGKHFKQYIWEQFTNLRIL